MSYKKIVKYGIYTLMIDLDNKAISIYNPCCREEVSSELPNGISWHYVHSILNPPAFLRKVFESEESLINKIVDFYFNKK